MITNDGKSIVGKYLISQAPAYAGFIAVGCGADPKQTASSNITAFAISGSTVTVTATNNFNANTPVIISIPGNRFTTLTNIASANTTNFTYAYGSTLPAITNAVSFSNVVTYTTATAHGLRSGDRVTIANLTSAYNASNVTVNVINTTSFSTYVDASGTATAADGAGDFTMNFTPPTNSLVIKNNADKTTLDYEMFRIPITSRGFDSESTINKVVLTGELPTQDRYLMTEIGIFSSGTNPTATTSDSRAVFTFTEGEGWEHHTSVSTTLVTSATQFQSSNVGTVNTASTLTASEDVFTLNSTNSIFDADAHKLSNAKPRNLSNFIIIRGDLSNINTSGAVWTATGEPHIHLTNQRFAFDANSSIDQLKLAFSVINRNPLSGANAAVSPDNLYVMVEFSSSESETDSENQYARMQLTLTSTDFNNSTGTRYFVATKTFGELLTSVGFTWDSVKVVKIYIEAGTVSTIDNTVTFKTLSGTGNVTANLSLGTLSHKFEVNDFVTVSGVGSPFDGTFVVTDRETDGADPTKNWIKYTVPAQASAIANTAVSPAGVASFRANYYILLDGMRFENISDMENNPLYGMTAYSTIQGTDTFTNAVSTIVPVTKDTNTNSLLEFKLNLELNSEG
ncbi:MAG: hypothetical protein K9J32_09250 [Synechococcus lacustris]|nr:hypothetical protein [Synechococcus lacustris]